MAKKNEIEILINATDNASGVLKNTQKSVTDLSDSTNSLSKVWEENKGKITAAAWVAFAWISYYLKQGINDVKSYNASVKRLEILTKNSTWATKEQVNALVQHAESLEKVWVATKDNIVAAMSQFATFDMSTEAIDKLTDSFVDYVVAEKWASATTDEYRQMANWLAQALQWNYASLTRTGFILDEETKNLIENGNEMERVSAIVKVLDSTYKDFNKSTLSSWVLLNRAFDDIRETLASMLLPIMSKVTEVMAEVVGKVRDWVQEHPKLATAIVWVVAALTWLISLIWAVSMTLPAIGTAISILSWPIWIVIAAITALWVAYATNFWGFRDFVNETWEVISPVLEELANAFIECFWEIWDCIKEIYSLLEPILLPLWEFFKEGVKESLGIVVDTVVFSFKYITEIIKGITKTFSEILAFIKNVFSWNWKEAFWNLENIVGIWKDTIVNIFADLWIDLPALFSSLKEKITQIWDTMFWWLKNICSSAVDWISDKISKIRDKINAAREAISWLWWWSSSASWGRASWGRVIAWETYRVNEIRWEYFTPAVNWTISSSPRNWSYEVNINFGNVVLNNWEDENQFAEKVREVMIEVFRNKALWTYA